MGCSEVGRSRLKRRTPSGLASNHRLPIGHIIVEIDGWGGLAQRRRGAEGEWGGLLAGVEVISATGLVGGKR